MNKKAELISSDVTEIVKMVEFLKEEINNLLFQYEYQLTYEVAYNPKSQIDGFGIAFLIKGNKAMIELIKVVLENQVSLMKIPFELPSTLDGSKFIGLTEFNGNEDISDYQHSNFIILGFEFV